MKIKQSDYPPAVVADLYYQGLGAVRALGRRGIPVIGIDSDPKAVGLSSRYCNGMVCPNVETSEEEHIDFLIRLSKNEGRKPVLFPTSDEYVISYAKYEDVLREYYHVTGPDRRVVEKVVTKEALLKTALVTGVAVPDTYIPKSTDDITGIAYGIRYPCIVKPMSSKSWKRPEVRRVLGGYRKVILARNMRELIEGYGIIAPFDSRVIVSEVIPGNDSELFYVAFYVSSTGEILGKVTGRKMRVIPIHFGSASFVETAIEDRVERITQKFLQDIGYRGLGGIEFKRDDRDGDFKLVELNARYGLWDVIGTRLGIDLAHIAYCDAIGLEQTAVNRFKEGVKWVSATRDTRAFIEYRKEGSVTFSSWIRSLRGEKVWAVIARDDINPFVVSLKHDLNGFFGYVKRHFVDRGQRTFREPAKKRKAPSK